MTNSKIFKYILSFLAPYRFSIGIVIFALSIVAGSILSLGRAVKMLIDEGLKAQDVDALNSAILYIVILIIALGLASFVRSYFINSIGEKAVFDIRLRVYEHLLKLKYTQFERLKPSDIVSRLSNDLELTLRIIVDTFSFCIRNSIMFCGSIVLMFTESSKLSLMVIIIVPSILILLKGLGTKVRKLSRNAQANLALISEFIGETFSGIKAVYGANAQQHKKNELANSSGEFLQKSLYRLKYRALFFALAISAIMCSIVFVIWIGSKDVLNGCISSGELVSFIFYAASGAMSLGSIAEVFGDLQRSLAASERIFTMLEINDLEMVAPNITDKNKNLNSAEIEFKNVSFAYPSRPEVKILENLNFEISEGEFVGIVGKTGSGKSTIMQLLLKYFEADSGQIKIRNSDLNSISNNECRKILGYVPQDPFMFAATIKENIELGVDYGGKLDKAVKITGLDEVLKLMPYGLNTNIGLRGSEVSGGQRQRIALARTIILNPDVLLLDEATSAMDMESEYKVMKEIQALMKGKTIITIAHRISSIQNTDRILVISEGKVLASGQHKDLLKNCSIYKKLCSEDE